MGEKGCICFDPFIRRPMYLPKNLVNRAEAHFLDKTSGKWVNLQAYGPTHLLDKLSSEWDRGLSTSSTIKRMDGK